MSTRLLKLAILTLLSPGALLAVSPLVTIIPTLKNGNPTHVHFIGGAQLSVCENFLFSALIGSSVGRNSPDLTCYLGFTAVF